MFPIVTCAFNKWHVFHEQPFVSYSGINEGRVFSQLLTNKCYILIHPVVQFIIIY